MKPTRGVAGYRIGGLSRERRTGLIALGTMLMLLAGIMLYQRLMTQPRAAHEVPTEDQPTEAAAVLHGTTPLPESMTEVSVEPLSRLAYALRDDWQVVKEYGSVDKAFDDFRIFTGIAVAAAPQTSVFSGGPGRVITVDQDPIDGGTVVVDHGAGLQSRYAGLGQIMVQIDQEVTAGQELGQIAKLNTGVRQSLGSHLFFQVFMNGDSIDPSAYFPN